MARYRGRDVHSLEVRARHAETMLEWRPPVITMPEPLSREELEAQREGLEAAARDLALRVAVWSEPFGYH